MSTNIQAVLDAIGTMKVSEMVELTRELERVYNVKSESAVVHQIEKQVEEIKVQEKEEFALWLEGFGESKVAVIKAVRELLGLGLKETMDLVSKAPVELSPSLKKVDAEAMAAKITTAGGVAVLK